MLSLLLFPQLRGRDPASRGDRYMLVNFEDVPYGIKVEFVFGSCPALHFADRLSLHRSATTLWSLHQLCREKSSGGAFIPLLKHGRHFVSMCAARNSGCYLYSEVISGGGGGGRGGRGGSRLVLVYLFGAILPRTLFTTLSLLEKC